MSIPETYYEWSQLVELLDAGENDAQVLDDMRNGKIEWQIGVASRFTKMISEVVDDRLNRAVDKFQYMLQNNGSNSLLEGILNTRREILFLRDVVSINAFDEPTRQKLISHVEDFSKQIQSSLESSAEKDSTGKLMLIIKQNPIDITKIQTEEGLL